MLKAHHDDSIASAPRRATGSTGWSRPSARPCTSGRLDAEVETGVGNGRVLAYLAQHAQIRDRTYDDDRVLLQCRLPRRCLDFLNENGAQVRTDGERLYA